MRTLVSTRGVPAPSTADLSKATVHSGREAKRRRIAGGAAGRLASEEASDKEDDEDEEDEEDEGQAQGGGEGVDGGARLLRQHLGCMEAVYSRVVLVSDSSARLAASPLDENPAYGLSPKPLRRFRFAALLVTHLERLGLSELQRCCCGADQAAATASEGKMIKRAKRACNASCHVRWPRVFGNQAPICLEICAGGGEWASAQAGRSPEMNWVASELRGDRIHQIFDRMRSGALPNLACLGGDAALALRHHTAPATFDTIWVNFPEPPADHSDRDAYLLNAAFFRDAYRTLTPGGSAIR